MAAKPVIDLHSSDNSKAFLVKDLAAKAASLAALDAEFAVRH